MKCPDCSQEMFMDMMSVGSVKPMVEVDRGRNLESRDEHHFCDCGTHIQASLIITRPNRIFGEQKKIETKKRALLSESSSVELIGVTPSAPSPLE